MSDEIHTPAAMDGSGGQTTLGGPGRVAVPVAPPARVSPWAAPFVAMGKGAGVLGVVVAAGVVGMIVLNAVEFPAWVGRHGVALGIAAVGGATALRWIRRGVKGELRAGAVAKVSAKVAEFGGGIYGALAFSTFLYLEAMDMVGEVAAAGSLWGFVSSLSIGWLIGQAMESVKFAVQAMMWPWFWFSELGARNAAFVAGGVWALDGLRRGFGERVGRWWRRRRGGVAASEEMP